MADISCFLTVNDDSTVKEYCDLFWSHATTNKLKVKGKSFEMESTRAAFVDESRTSIYLNTKNEKGLLLNCYGCDMPKMGAMMGGAKFAEMGSLLWDMDPATGLKLRVNEPTGAKADLICFADLKEGTSVEDYTALFWSHADSTTLVCKGKTYEMESTRGAMCDEARTAVYVNSQDSSKIAICVYDCDVAKLGAMMGGDKFKEIAEVMWTMTGMQYMVSPPPPPKPTLFAGTWKILESARVPCTTFFASMTPEDDVAEAGNVNLLGRWSDVGTCTGVFVCEAPSVMDVQAWLYGWMPMATCDVKPICDDNTAREIILKAEPKWRVDYSGLGEEPRAGESLYHITFKFYQGMAADGHKAFAGLTEEQDKADCGSCRPLGRFHDLGNGSGFCIAAASSAADLYKWAYNWASMCEIEVRGVATDKQGREMIRGKPDYAAKLAEVKAAMAPKKSGWKLW